MPAREDRGEDLLDDLALPDDDAVQLVEHLVAVGGELREVFGESILGHRAAPGCLGSCNYREGENRLPEIGSGWYTDRE